MLEENLRRALALSRGDSTVFVTRPVSLVMLLVAAGLLVLIVAPAIRRKRDSMFTESGWSIRRSDLNAPRLDAKLRSRPAPPRFVRDSPR